MTEQLRLQPRARQSEISIPLSLMTHEYHHLLKKQIKEKDVKIASEIPAVVYLKYQLGKSTYATSVSKLYRTVIKREE